MNSILSNLYFETFIFGMAALRILIELLPIKVLSHGAQKKMKSEKLRKSLAAIHRIGLVLAWGVFILFFPSFLKFIL